MTNVEYKNFALKVLKEFSIENEECIITNISELFLLKIREALIKNKKKGNSYVVAKEFNLIYNAAIPESNQEEIENKNYLSPYTNLNSISISDSALIKQSQIINFCNIQLLIREFPNVESILQGLGIEHPQELLHRIKSINDITTDEDKEKVYNIMEKLEEADSNKGYFFTFLSIYINLRRIILKALEFDDFDIVVLSFLKSIKNIVEKYQDIYIERFKKYLFIMEHFDEYFDEHLEAIIRIGEKMAEKLIPFQKMILNHYPNLWENMDEEDEESSLSFSPALIMDFFFMFYFVTYENPFWVKWGFYLTSEKAPYHLRLGMIDSLQDNKFSPIIQYEYECFCKQNVAPSIPLQFYSGTPIDLNSLNIEYYKLDQWDMDIQSLFFSKNMKILTIKEDKMSVMPDIDKADINKIVHNLEPYFKIFEQRSSKEKGSIFKRDYLSQVVTLSEKLSGSLAVHGFAYIIYNSKFFNWGKETFDDSFIYKIAETFNIVHKLGTKYPLNKCQIKAKAILEKESLLQGLWNKNI